MVLRSAELSECPVENWKNYSLDYVQIKSEIAKLVKRLAFNQYNYQSKAKELRGHKKSVVVHDGIPDLSLNDTNSIPDKSNNNGLKSVYSNDQIATTNSTNSSVYSSSMVSSSSSNDFSITFSNNNPSDKEVSNKLNELKQAYQIKKNELVRNFIKKVIHKNLTNVEMFINLKNLELTKTFESNSNNFKKNNKNIINEVVKINKRFTDYQSNLFKEADTNNDFLIQLNAIHETQNAQQIPSLNVNGLKRLNAEVVSRNLEVINNDNTKLDQKVNEIKNDLFLNLINFINFQKQIVFHLLHFLNKCILKSSQIGQYYDYYEDFNDTGNEYSINYIDLLYLVKGPQKLNTTKLESQILINDDYLNLVQEDLLLSFNERYNLFKSIFENIFGNGTFNEEISNELVGGTIYERELIYFNKFNSNLVKDLSDKDIEYNDCFQISSLKLSKLKFWSLSLSNEYDLISEVLEITDTNFGIYSKVLKLIGLVNNQRSLLNNPEHLNYVYSTNNVHQYIANEELIDSLNHKNDSFDSLNFDIDSTKCDNSAWFLISNPFLYEIRFLLDSLFDKVDNNSKKDYNERLQLLLEKISRNQNDDFKNFQRIHYYDTKQINCHEGKRPVEIFEKDSINSVAVGGCGSLGKMNHVEFETSFLKEFDDNFNEDKFKDYFKIDLNYRRFKGIFKNQHYKVADFDSIKERYVHEQILNKRYTKFFISLHSNIKFYQDNKVINSGNYSLIELNWDGDTKVDNSIDNLINSNFVYEVPYYTPMLFCVMAFKYPVYEIHTIDKEWFNKITSKKFQLFRIIKNRLLRSQHKRELMTKLQQQALNESKPRVASNGHYNSDPTSIGKRRYWNEFDDNPEEWGDGQNGFYMDDDDDDDDQPIIGDKVINYFIDLSEKLSTSYNKLNGLIFKNENSRRFSQLNENDSLLNQHYRYDSGNSSESYTGYESSDDERSLIKRYHSQHVNYGADNHHHNNESTAFEIGPESQRIKNHDMIATFLYFVFPTISTIITGLSLGIVYSIILNENYEYSNTSYILIMTSLVFGLTISFLLATISMILLLGRITTAPIHHYAWVSSVFIAVLVSIVVVLLEFAQI